MEKIDYFLLGVAFFCMVIIVVLITHPIVSQGATWDERQFQNASANNTCQIYNFGNGTLFFDCTDLLYYSSLSQYIGSHNVSVTSMAPAADQNTQNDEYGYIVTVIPKGEC